MWKHKILLLFAFLPLCTPTLRAWPNLPYSEVSLGAGFVYDEREQRWCNAQSFYTYGRLNEDSRWTYGSGLELALEAANFATLVPFSVSYEVVKQMKLELVPGFSLGKTNSSFSLKFGATYDIFRGKIFRFGPTFGCSWFPRAGNSHVALGVQATVSF